MSTLLQALKTPLTTQTQNGALTLATTKSHVLDFFALGGALRNRDDKDVIELFENAYAENRLLALKTLFYFRDIRGGQGEKKIFKTIIKNLAIKDAQSLKKNLEIIPFYGRWDDLFILLDTPLKNDVLKLVKKQFIEDLEALKKDKKVSLLAKWCPSLNTSSALTRAQAEIIREYLNITPKSYRKGLVALRKKIGIVEREMCANNWGAIDYKAVPSKAGLLYRKAFSKKDATRYIKYINDVKAGKTKINAGVLYPYEIIKNVYTQYDQTLEALWKALPDYTQGKNGLVVCDVSGSMTGGGGKVRPIDVSISLGLYFAEKNEGKFGGHFITFSNNPKLQKISGNNLQEKVNNLSRSEWAMSTNLQAVFDLVLNRAIEWRVPQSEMPGTIYIISDMEFNIAVANNRNTNFDEIKAKYLIAGYELPTLVFWNVNAMSNQVAVSRNQEGAILVSGCSPSIFKNVMEGKDYTPYDFMLEVLTGQRYNKVV